MSDIERAAKALYEGDGGRPEIWENIGDELRQTYRDKAAAVDTRTTTIKVGKGSTVLAERRFYEDTYLIGDDGSAILFICDAAVVRGPSGREKVRSKHDVLEFDSSEALVAAVAESDWAEAPLDKKPRWTPSREQVETAGEKASPE